MDRHIDTPAQNNAVVVDQMDARIANSDWRTHPTDMLVLVVEDDSVSRHLLRRVLEAQHYRVEEAENGEQALALYKLHQPTMVLLDAIMPGISGFDVCTEIQALPGGEHTVVIM